MKKIPKIQKRTIDKLNGKPEIQPNTISHGPLTSPLPKPKQ